MIGRASAGDAVLIAVFMAWASTSIAAQTAATPIDAANLPAAATRSENERTADARADAPTGNPLIRFFAATRVTGMADAYYSFNVNTPQTPCSAPLGVAVFNCLRAFDVAHNALTLNLLELALEKIPSRDSRAGYRLDLDYGAGATLVAAFEPGGSARIHRSVQQAYVSFLTPAGPNGLRIDVGKFVTPAGLEVIESKDNWNYSRGLLFTLGMPRYHQGVRIAYRQNDQLSVSAFLANGWNDAGENNGAKSVGVQAATRPTAPVAVTATYIGGPEIPDDNADWRHFVDVVATVAVSPFATLAVDYVAGKELSSRWQGGAVYLRLHPKASFSLTPRYELFNDRDGWALVGQPVQEFTLTAELRRREGLLTRVEYRQDWTLDPFFVKNVRTLVKSQKTVTVAWVYSFSAKGRSAGS